MINFTKELNTEQCEVVFKGDGPCLVLAGAGSGKTRTITYRVAYLLEKGINPNNVLLLTFTNKAANVMNSRVEELTNSNQKMPWAGTFHGVAYKILKINAEKVGYEKNFTVLDSEDSKTILKNVIKQYKPADVRHFPSVNVISNIFSYSKNSGESLEDTLEIKGEYYLEFIDEFRKISFAYDKDKRKSNSMDFDDLLINLNTLLDNEEIQKKYSTQFKYILVDEYQDTNHLQFQIVKKLSQVHKNILVVGDDAQSIYSFRAAQIENILNFEDEYKNTKIFKLETNYRSTKEILDVANDVISQNTRQYKKKLKTTFLGAPPKVKSLTNQTEEAIYIVNEILDFVDQNYKYKNIAVLFRAAHHSQQLEIELNKRGIDYDYRGGVRFFERAHIKDVLAYLKVLNNSKDAAAWFRVLLLQAGLGPMGAKKIIEVVQKVKKVEEIEMIVNNILKGKAKSAWDNFLKIWKEMVVNKEKSPKELIELIKNSDYKEFLQNEYTNFKERVHDIEQLGVFAGRYNSLSDFLAEAILQEGYNSKQIQENKDKKNKVVLSTIHQAKGLEWDIVFVVNLTQGNFPNERASQTSPGLEEERRLFYVAVTRARKFLFLTYSLQTRNWGESVDGPSLFLSEISADKLSDESYTNLSTSFNDEVEYLSEDRPSTSFLSDIDNL